MIKFDADTRDVQSEDTKALVSVSPLALDQRSTSRLETESESSGSPTPACNATSADEVTNLRALRHNALDTPLTDRSSNTLLPVQDILPSFPTASTWRPPRHFSAPE